MISTEKNPKNQKSVSNITKNMVPSQSTRSQATQQPKTTTGSLQKSNKSSATSANRNSDNTRVPEKTIKTSKTSSLKQPTFKVPSIDPFMGPISKANGLSMRFNAQILFPNVLDQLNKVIDSYHIAEGYYVHSDCKKLHSALIADDIEMVKLFINQCSGAEDQKTFNSLISKSIDNDDNNIFHLTFREHFKPKEISEQNSVIFKYLVSSFPKLVNQKANYNGMLPIHYIGYYPHLESLRLILNQKIKISGINQKTNENVGHYFASQAANILKNPGLFEKVLYLFLVSGVNFNLQNTKGQSPMDILLGRGAIQGQSADKRTLNDKVSEIALLARKVNQQYNALLIGYLLHHEMKDTTPNKTYKLRNLSWEARINIIKMLAS